MNQKSLILAFIPALAVVGCKSSSSGYVPPKVSAMPAAALKPGDELSAMPLAVGNQWTFDEVETVAAANGENRRIPAEVVIRCAKVTDVPGGKEGLLEVMNGDKVSNRLTWRVTQEGIFQVTNGLDNGPITPPQPIAKFPMKEGEETKWTGTGPFGKDKAAKQTSTLTTRGSRLVDTGMGQVSALYFTSSTDVQGSKGAAKTEMSLWLKPGTGIAKLIQLLKVPDGQQLVVLSLKNFTPKS